MEWVLFVASKTVSILVRPDTWLILVLVLALVKVPKPGRVGLVRIGVSVLVLLVWALPVGRWAVLSLERHAIPPSEAVMRETKGIIVLGGALDGRLSVLHDAPQYNSAAERVLALIALRRALPEHPVIFSGGSGAVFHPEIREADFVQRTVAAHGVAPDSILWERASRNTFEHPPYIRELLHARGLSETGRWLLVTSAAHLPRASAVFRHAGFDVVPYPVDFRAFPERARGGGDIAGNWTDWFDFSMFGDLELGRIAMHEWTGLFVYAILGRIDSPWPKSDPLAKK